jgi:predicted  nucleic acid-binding Zn-ribbon protein
MIYTFNSLTTIAACDEYVNDCGREKTALENKKNNLLERLENNAGTSDLQARVDFLTQRINSDQALIDSNPPEKDLREMQIQLGEMIKERATIERKIDQIGDNWQIETVFEINACEAEMALRDTLIAEINAYKATLAA